jgi:hypothetical protein
MGIAEFRRRGEVVIIGLLRESVLWGIIACFTVVV